MRIGFTGTRAGLTAPQRATLAALIEVYGAGTAHHGDALGADAQFRALLGDDDFTWTTVAHPSNIPSMTANTQNTVRRPPKPPLDRNRDIVDECELLLACPKGTAEEQRSGTWATIRYARKVGRKVVIVWPDGTTD